MIAISGTTLRSWQRNAKRARIRCGRCGKPLAWHSKPVVICRCDGVDKRPRPNRKLIAELRRVRW